MITAKPNTINEYIAGFPEGTRQMLQQLREAIQKAAPDAAEAVKYRMPTFTRNGNLVHFAAYKNHIGFYALPAGNEAFKDELAAYKTGKGSIQFPLHKPLPLELIAKMVQFRVKRNEEKARKKIISKPSKAQQ